MSDALYDEAARHRATADTAPARRPVAGAQAGHPLAALQRSAGNAAVVQLLGAHGDHDEDGATAQRSPVLDIVGRGGGAPLPGDVRQRMETSFGSDFGDVRVHDDSAADSSARGVGAHAYTVGNDMVFRSGAYDPASQGGQRTIAHELTHVVQQRSGPVDGTPTGGGVSVSDPSDRFEREAESTADRVMTSEATAQLSAAGPALQREAVPEEEEPVQTMVQREETPEEETA